MDQETWDKVDMNFMNFTEFMAGPERPEDFGDWDRGGARSRRTCGSVSLALTL